MAAPSFLEKLAILLEVSKSSKIFIIAIIIMLFIGLLLITTNRINVKSSRRLFILFYIFIVVSIFVIYKESLSQMIEYLMNNLFVVIYFPNLAVYLAAIIIANIILWFSVFNFKTTTMVKNINIIVYLIINYLLVVLLTIVSEEKLDVFNQSSIYGNKSAQAIIELTSILFISWIIFLILYKAIMTYLTRNNKLPIKPQKVVIKNSKRILPKNIREVATPHAVKAVPMVSAKVRSQDTAMFDKLLTIEDYKLLLNILKEKREKDRLEAIQKEKREKELAKFRELQDLYGVR